ncbi:MAG: cyclohexanecarboxyl-CoA dehydrogenase [Alphaproteobacteria bacterium]|jgi:cyclohexanecarboxyl-CoA dehydrogenase|nr:cyclohexanecarboxyl-CoA dehydrogenase [Alphaproteobacteria bacterium]MBT4020332.1 cyclohexanecarboxyl-CoA dehydrogenase [Alphaproteobacteria bacterium]MBT5161408.1 cyclohexanecarboxyl-CoA dehydrogenase [Alphaproteobacteria bacterium]
MFETEELLALRDTTRRFASEKIAPGYAARETDGVLDRQLLQEMGAMGLIAPELPEWAGGSGVDTLYSGVIIEEIAKADFNMGYAQILGSLEGQILARFAHRDVAEEWLPKLTAGEVIINVALTEPQGGSDAAALRLKMSRDGDDWILNGEKTSISMVDQSEATVVFARSGEGDQGGQGAKGVSALLVPMDLPGIRTTRFEDLGQHCIGRGSIFFDNVRVPGNLLLGEEGMAFRQVMQGFDFSRALIGLQCLGTARQSLDEAWAFVKERHAFGQPLSAFQGVSHKLAEFDTKVEAARLLCLNALWLKDHGRPHTTEAAMSKWWPPLLAYETIHGCLLMHGHAGYSRDLPFEQRLRDVLGLQIGDGTSQIMKTVIARSRVGRENVPY